MRPEPLLRMEGITKRFPGVLALDNVDFEVYKGEIVALVGENGAGKTTLIELLQPHPAPTGYFRKDRGSIYLKGKPIDPQTPLDAERLGIATIHQEFNLTPNLTVEENIFLGREPRVGRLRGPFAVVDRRAMGQKSKALLQHLKVDVRPRQLVRHLPVAQQQMVEITKALSLSAELMIMDEPTSALTSREVDALFDLMRRLKADGISIVFITHRLEEVFRVADRIVVLRDGRRVGELSTAVADMDTVISMMVGRTLDLFPKARGTPGETVLEVRRLNRGRLTRDVSFALRRGEILGFAGLVGAGRTETMRALFGVDRRDSGEILLDGRPVEIGSPRDAVRVGIGMVPEDRKLQGLILGMAVRENITLPALGRLTKWLVVILREERALARTYITRLAIRTPGTEQKVKGLSGGNQQKVVLAKWLALHPRVLILDEPTRGIDVGAKAEVHSIMDDLAREGIGIIMVSSELPEILGMADRVIVMADGRVTGEFDRDRATQEGIMACAAGQAPPPGAPETPGTPLAP